MRRLKGAVPRVFRDHRSKEAKRYGDVVTAMLERLGPLPRCAGPILREYGLSVLAGADLAAEQQQAKARGRVTVMRRIRRDQGRNRLSMMALERRLEQLAGMNGYGGDLAREIQEAQREDS